jgi:hypothetical protein
MRTTEILRNILAFSLTIIIGYIIVEIIWAKIQKNKQRKKQ